MPINCQRCSRGFPDVVMLCGIYRARLCDRCCDAWHHHIVNSEAWRDMRFAEYNAKASLQACQSGSVDRRDAYVGDAEHFHSCSMAMVLEAMCWIEAGGGADDDE